MQQLPTSAVPAGAVADAGGGAEEAVVAAASEVDPTWSLPPGTTTQATVEQEVAVATGWCSTMGAVLVEEGRRAEGTGEEGETIVAEGVGGAEAGVGVHR